MFNQELHMIALRMSKAANHKIPSSLLGRYLKALEEMEDNKKRFATVAHHIVRLSNAATIPNSKDFATLVNAMEVELVFEKHGAMLYNAKHQTDRLPNDMIAQIFGCALLSPDDFITLVAINDDGFGFDGDGKKYWIGSSVRTTKDGFDFVFGLGFIFNDGVGYFYQIGQPEKPKFNILSQSPPDFLQLLKQRTVVFSLENLSKIKAVVKARYGIEADDLLTVKERQVVKPSGETVIAETMMLVEQSIITPARVPVLSEAAPRARAKKQNAPP